jgi:ribonuclease HII
LAGPVCAAAVILPKDFPFDVLDDSKKLTAACRESAKQQICSKALAWGIGWASSFEIDEINILQASLLAMRRAFESMRQRDGNIFDDGQLAVRPLGAHSLEAIVDGLYTPDISIPCRAIVKADSKVPEVMAASILAKTARDRLMEIYSIFYPDYGYAQHKGYPTKAHREAIARLGPSPIQRMTFRVRPEGG